MEVDLLNRGGAGTAQPTSAIAAAAGSPAELFTKLLVAQIKNQNPLEPTDPGEFVSQLTQLSQMESLQSLASLTSANAGAMESLQVLTLGGQVGSQVTVVTDRVVLGQEKVHASFELADPAAQATVILTGPNGKEERISLGSQASGDNHFIIDPAERGFAAGTYSIRIETDTKEAPAVNVTGTLSTVKLTTNGVLLDVTHVGQVSSKFITQFKGKQTV